MSRKFKVPLGLVGLDTNPASGSLGDTYFNTDDGFVYVYDGSDWQQQATATYVSSAISGLTAGMPSPSDIMKECSFATNFVDNNLPEPFKEQEIPEPAFDTANRATVDAATNRILGNPKIPAPNFKSMPVLQVGTYDSTGRQLTAQETQALVAETPTATATATPVTTTTSTPVPTNNFAERRAAIDDMNAKKAEYEKLAAEYGRLDPRTEAAFQAYKEALAYLDKF